jgi:hypothetical protein
MFGRFANPERELYRDLEQPLAEISRQSDLNLFEVFVIAKALDREIHGHSFWFKGAGAQPSLGRQSRIDMTVFWRWGRDNQTAMANVHGMEQVGFCLQLRDQ